MSNLYGSMRGARGETTRCGVDHITAHLRSWDLGVRVDVYYDKKTKETTCYVTATKGSNGGGIKQIATFSSFDTAVDTSDISGSLSRVLSPARRRDK